MRSLLFISVLFSLAVFPGRAQQFVFSKLKEIPTGACRGMSMTKDGTVWLAGTKGVVVRDCGGRISRFVMTPLNAPDLRSIWGFDSLRAIAVGIGSPALVFRTIDGGANWEKVFELNHPDAFLDGITFWDDYNGLIYGDPIDGKMVVLRTKDSGKTWHLLPDKSLPKLEPGEASFAASGTGIRCFGRKGVMVATGGSKSRLWKSSNRGKSWKSMEVPILQGQPSQGIFSFSFFDKKNGAVVGGDYVLDTLRSKHVLLTKDGGKTWLMPTTTTRGYRECVQYLDKHTLIACGPTGTDGSTDGGMNWFPVSDERGFHVLQISPKGIIRLAGAGGRYATIVIE